MANNVMFLVNRRTGQRVKIARYFPSGGWSMYKEAPDWVNAAFDKADDFDYGSPGIMNLPMSTFGMYGGNEWYIEYDVVDPPMQKGHA